MTHGCQDYLSRRDLGRKCEHAKSCGVCRSKTCWKKFAYFTYPNIDWRKYLEFESSFWLVNQKIWFPKKQRRVLRVQESWWSKIIFLVLFVVNNVFMLESVKAWVRKHFSMGYILSIKICRDRYKMTMCFVKALVLIRYLIGSIRKTVREALFSIWACWTEYNEYHSFGNKLHHVRHDIYSTRHSLYIKNDEYEPVESKWNAMGCG